MLAEPLVFGGVVYFTTYTPPSATSTDCTQDGNALLYGISYTTGAGALENGDRSVTIGTGIPSAPVVSKRPGGSGVADLYVTVSGGFTGDYAAKDKDKDKDVDDDDEEEDSGYF